MRKFSLTLGRFDGDGFSSAISNSKHRTRRFSFFTAAEFRGSSVHCEPVWYNH